MSHFQHFSLYSCFQYSKRLIEILPIAGFERRSLESEATALPTEPQPLTLSTVCLCEKIVGSKAATTTEKNEKEQLIEIASTYLTDISCTWNVLAMASLVCGSERKRG